MRTFTKQRRGAGAALRQRMGFTLQELLLVVAILGIIFAVAMPAAAQVLRNVQQMEMDAKAETIYLAAQNQLTKLQASGDAALEDVALANAEGVVKKAPGDSNVTVVIEDGQLYFATNAAGSAGKAGDTLSCTVEDELKNNYWVIEYDYSSASVYAVFYSEDASQLSAYPSVVGEQGGSTYDALRDRDERLAQGALVGYYGGDIGSSSQSSTLEPKVTVVNQEKLTANIVSISPSTSSASGITFTLTLTDGQGNSWTKDVMGQRAGRSYTYDLTFDDLSADSTRFTNTYGDANWLIEKGWQPVASTGYQVGLVPGTSLSIAVKAKLTTGSSSVKESSTVTAVTNSLFGYDRSASSETALISYVRHLQNLDQSSGVASSITNAQLQNDLDLADDETTDDDWASVYASSYFNGQAAEGAAGGNFRPLVNASLASFNGGNFCISNFFSTGTLADGAATGDVALFASADHDMTLNDLKLYRAKAQSASGVAAGLVAVVAGGTVTVSNCGCYLSNVISGLADDGFDQTDTWITGKKASGGLVGQVAEDASVQISQSFGASVVGSLDTGQASASTGGLVGSAQGSVTITESYADSYAYGTTVGGLVGQTGSNAAVTLQSCYAAGFLASTTNSEEGVAAGLVAGKVQDASTCYTVCSYLSSVGFEPGEEYAGDKTAPSILYTINNVAASQGNTLSDVFYVDCNVDDPAKLNINVSTAGVDPSISSDIPAATLRDYLNAGGASFTTEGSAIPYNAMGQTLTSTYPYAMLDFEQDSAHYGDWGATFQSGSLVYFEHYRYASDKTNAGYGFYGANVSSTLHDSSDYLVDGDGYGIVYQQNGQIPETMTLTVTSSDGDITTTVSKNDPHYSVTGKNGTTYVIYPLKDENVRNFGYGIYADATKAGTYNQSKDYYLRAVIQATGSEPTYWFFNPHFAKTVEQASSADAKAPAVQTIRVRTGRHLYDLSKFYVNYRKATEGKVYYQELDIDYGDYDWTTYTDAGSQVTEQEPVGIYQDSSSTSKTVTFTATYNGNCHTITGLSIKSKFGQDIGLFAQNEGTIRNTVLVCDYDPDASAAEKLTVYRGSNIENGAKMNMGVLAGSNLAGGSIVNSATAGYYLSGTRGRLNVYSGSTVYVGGLVGYNAGSIARCSADTPLIGVNNNSSYTYAAGFAGCNDGTISNSYAIGAVKSVMARAGNLVLSGFVGRNKGRVSNSYCATALTASGDCSSYGFASEGTISGCSFLNKGVFTYIGAAAAYDNDKNASSSTTYEQMKAQATTKAAKSLHHPNTDEKTYPFRAVVTDASGSYVHYGDWQTEVDLGTLGVFYWEHEESGDNNGYHLYAVGFADGVTKRVNDTLCTAHDDGGIITEYGYGYYAEPSQIDDVSLSLDGIGLSGSQNTTASKALKSSIPGFAFVAYNTSVDDGLYLSDTSGNTSGTMKISYGGYSYSYEVSPFFAASIAFKSSTSPYVTDAADTGTGEEANQYQVRSADQLQYINWNSSSKTCSEYMQQSYFNNTTAGVVATSYATSGKAVAFPYLGYAYCASGPTNKVHHSANLYWKQTHDVDANMPNDDTELFYPLGSLYDSNWASATNTSYIYTNYFNGSYDGGSYTIRNVQINSKSQSTGLFGIAIGAKVSNVFLTSDNGNYIRANAQGTGWYCLGGMAGMALLGGSGVPAMTGSAFSNCSVSGYHIRDERANHGFGGSNIGGFVGLTNLSLSQCTAVNTVDVALTYSDSSRNVRTGGMVGNFRGTNLTDCYAGGSIVTNVSSSTATNIHAGGIVGGWFMRTQGNMSTLFGSLNDKPTVKNCYSYVDLRGVAKNASLCPIVTNCNNEDTSNNFTVTNCYYYEQGSTTYTTRNVDGSAVKVTYDTLSDQTGTDMAAKLGSNWGWVTVKEGTAYVHGKYSFPAGDASLEGMDYPFPTILTQDDQTGFSDTVNVHYGSWPQHGIAWEEGEASMDILRDLDFNDNTVSQKGSAKSTFTLNWLEEGSSASGEVVISAKRADGTDVSEGVDVADVYWTDPTAWSSNQSTLAVYPRREGIYTITAQCGSYEASFRLVVTASMSASVEPETLKLAQDTSGTVALAATSSVAEGAEAGNDLTKLCRWEAAYDDESYEVLFDSSLYQAEGHAQTGISEDKITNYQDSESASMTYTCTFPYTFDGTSSPGSADQQDFSATCFLTVKGFDASLIVDVTLDAGEGTIDGTDEQSKTYTLGPDDTLEFPGASRAGYEFTGWSNGSTSYAEGDEATAEDLKDEGTFKAQWDKLPTLTLASSGASTESQEFLTGTAVSTASALDGYTAPTRSGMTLAGWFTEKDSSGVQILDADGTLTSGANVSDYVKGGKLKPSANATLYACWLKEVQVYAPATSFSTGKSFLLAVKSGSTYYALAGSSSAVSSESLGACDETFYDATGKAVSSIALRASDAPESALWQADTAGSSSKLHLASDAGSYLSYSNNALRIATSASATSFTYNGTDLQYASTGGRRTTYYLRLNGTSFAMTSSSSQKSTVVLLAATTLYERAW